jgi:hypothetical protein
MIGTLFTAHEGLGTARRFPSVLPAASRVLALQLGLMVLIGCAIAVLCQIKLSLRVPGHNIIRVVLPMALGLWLAPRRGAATVMGLSGMAMAGALSLGGRAGLGTGALTSLALTGLLLDLALWGARSGWSVYVRLTLAGLAANLLAMLVRGGSKWLSGGAVDGLPIELWWPTAVFTYPLCGLLAGLISAVVWFRASRGN